MGSCLKFLRKFRQAFELDQGELGDILGAPQSTYSRWERGQSNPGKEVRQQLADLGVNLHWLETGEGEMLRPGVSLDVVVIEGRKQLRKTVRADAVTSGGGNTHSAASKVSESHPGYGPGDALANRPEPAGPRIFPSMVAQAAEMVDAVIQSMPPEHRPTDEKRWEAYALIARCLAEDKAEGREGRARTFLLGLKVEWAEVPTKSGA